MSIIEKFKNPKLIFGGGSLATKEKASFLLKKIYFYNFRARSKKIQELNLSPIGVMDENVGFTRVDFPTSILNPALSQGRKVFSNIDWVFEKNNNEKKYLLVHSLAGKPLPDIDSILDLALYPPLIKMIREYLGFVPVIKDMWVWNSPNDGNVDNMGSQFFHLDGQDARTLQLFIFLNDVDLSSGPLQVIDAVQSENICRDLNYKKSGKSKRLSDELVLERIREGSISSLVGLAGTSFIADTDRCLHLGSRGSGRPRHQIVIQYFSPWSFVPASPWWSMLPELAANKYNRTFSKLEKMVLGSRVY